ncbi:MAG: hypothetical protein RDV41_03220 [Planctomycetota bacterium]|nr:hypothetical protein [Planctomycetota bacterium]
MFFKRTLPLTICFVMGVLFAAQYFVPHPWSEDLLTLSQEWTIVVGAFAAFLGYYSIVRVHAIKVKRHIPGWGFSVVALASFAVMFVLGCLAQGASIDPASGKQTVFGWVYSNMMVPLQGTMFSILAFFIASAAFRAFRARTFEAALLLLAAVVVMFGRVPLGEYIWKCIFPGGPGGGGINMANITDWVMSFPNMAGQRGIAFGIVLGGLAMSLRIIFGIEKTYLGGGKE